jgi:hypothetical protein
MQAGVALIGTLFEVEDGAQQDNEGVVDRLHDRMFVCVPTLPDLLNRLAVGILDLQLPELVRVLG